MADWKLAVPTIPLRILEWFRPLSSRESRSPPRKSDKFRPLLFLECSKNSPKPLTRAVCFAVSMVCGMLPELIDVNVGVATHV